MKLEIITPEKIIFTGKADIVTLPGISGKFSILDNHAPLIASLGKGVISFKNKEDGIRDYSIESGLCEVRNNEVYVCVEHINSVTPDGSAK
ncbi:MAG: ATP synthase F1 subunit epsilon [Paludibacter sp.]|nr:ATP synthase F1 subunit epsilon [Paludibacter sp.]